MDVEGPACFRVGGGCPIRACHDDNIARIPEEVGIFGTSLQIIGRPPHRVDNRGIVRGG